MRPPVSLLVPGLLLVAGGAPAHVGMAPASIDALAPGMADATALEATFGLILSVDDGATYRWYCHETVAQYSATVMPSYAWSSDGVLLASLSLLGQGVVADASLYRSVDGCDWDYAEGTLGHVITDMTFDPDDPSRAVAVTGNLEGLNRILVSEDGGESFAPSAVVDVAPVFRSIVLAGGSAWASSLQLEPLRANLHHSPDGGWTWTDHPIVVDAPEGPIPLVTVYAASPHGLTAWLRYDDGPAEDRLLRTTDGGQTLDELARVDGDIRDVALDPTDDSVWLATSAGLLRSTGGAFEVVAGAPDVEGLATDAEGVLFATNHTTAGYSLARFDGDFVPILELYLLEGPAECAPDSDSVELCDPNWGIIEAALPEQYQGDDDDSAAGDDDDDDSAAPAPADCCSGSIVGGAGPGVLTLVVYAAFWRRRRIRSSIKASPGA